MYWFKNLIIYRITDKVDWNLEKLQQSLLSMQYVPCSSYDKEKMGWNYPFTESESLFYLANNKILLVAQKEEKILPAQVVRREYTTKLQEAEQKEGNRLKNNAKLALKDEITAQLTARAFSKIQTIHLCIDIKNNLIYIDSASFNKAEKILALLRKTLGSLPVIPLTVEHDTTKVMTAWLLEDKLPQWLNFYHEAELKTNSMSGIIKCKQQELQDDEIINHLKAGKNIYKLALDWDDHLSFVLSEDFTFKRLKYANTLKETNQEAIDNDRITADFHLMINEISELVIKLLPLFGGEKQD